MITEVLYKKHRHMNKENFQLNLHKILINMKEGTEEDKFHKYCFDKYFIKCKEELTENLFVIKLGNFELIQKDFNINKKIKNIEGFISYNFICESYNNNYLLEMPYISSKSLGEIKWKNTEEDKLKLKSLYKQIILSYLVAFKKTKFIHNSKHLDNYLLKETDKEYIDYELIKVKTYGVQVIIMDFEKSIDKEYNISPLSSIKYNNDNFIEVFFRNIRNLFNKEFKYIDIKKGAIISHIETIEDSKDINKIIEILDLIDNIDFMISLIENIY
jgi:hypothetical protein